MRRLLTGLAIAAALLAPGGPSGATGLDDGVIRLGGPADESVAQARVRIEEPRRGFDYVSFETRLQTLWFQRSTFLRSQRYDDATAQLERIRTFCAQEGVGRLEELSGALVAEARRFAHEGNYPQALRSLDYAEVFDPGRPQVRMARTSITWQSGNGLLSAGLSLVATARASIVEAIGDLTLVHQSMQVAGLALWALVLAFGGLMLLRHHPPIRHEIEEAVAQRVEGRWPSIAGWAVLVLPLLAWVGAGWIVLWWLLLAFRFMTRGERAACAMILVALAAHPLLDRTTVAVYGATADPAVRTTLAAVDGEYSPDRVVRLRKLVERHPDEAVYRFLLAGVYRNGRYYEEAFEEYKRALEIDPRLAAAHINIGNIFYTTGQFPEAIANYRQAVEARPGSMLAYFNMHLAQSEAFRFEAAEESLRRARSIDASAVARLLSDADGWGDRPAVHDAGLEMASVWDAALGGRDAVHGADPTRRLDASTIGALLVNPLTLASLICLFLCLVSLLLNRAMPPARSCIQCGRAFCFQCKSGHEAQEYCSQCVHLFVLGDGLAPGTKSRKLYEVQRHERMKWRIRRGLGLVVPGAAQVLRGRVALGLLLAFGWFAALFAVWPALPQAMAGMMGSEVRMELLYTPTVPALYQTSALALIAIGALPAIWLIGNAWRWRVREV